SPDQVANLSGGGAPDAPAGGDFVSIEEARRIPIFEIHKEIGQGGMATVFLATNKKNGRQCALKVLFTKHTSNAKFVERFIREGKLLREFDTENIAKGFEYGVVGKDSAKPLYFMSMEYIEGPSIQDLLDKEGSFDEQKCIYVITEAAKGLAYMQERGVVHRDIKPDNIMWSQDGRVMLVDLGFASPIRSDAAGEYEDETCGTVQYISPEQAKGQADVDIRADIYSLGCTFYHMLIGELPFSGKDSMDIMAKQVMEGLNSGKFKKVSVHMHYFIEKMMSKDRDFRYQTAREIVEDIEEVLEGAADLQYDPAEDVGNSSIFGFDPNASQRMSAHSTGNFTPVPRTSHGRLSPTGESVRMAPSGRSVRVPGSNSTSVRQPLKQNTKSTGSIRRPSVSGTNPGVNKPGTSVRMPQKNNTNPPSSSVRMPTNKSVRMPKRKS
ncbi:MAG: serine/threonine-protein kinase, partial [Planctomycetota bacterium]